MTPAQLDHLRRIDAHLANLLATAEKRTPGEWEHCQQSVWVNNEGSWINCPNLYANAEHNAAFIASCAGNAEAGWRATRAAIKGLLATCEGFTFPDEDRPEAYAALQDILDAFPNI